MNCVIFIFLELKFPSLAQFEDIYGIGLNCENGHGINNLVIYLNISDQRAMVGYIIKIENLPTIGSQ